MSRRARRLAITTLVGLVTVGLVTAGCAARVTRTGPLPDPTTTGPSVEANEAAAQQEARRLLTLARVPPGAVDLSTPPPALTGPPMLSTVETAATAARYWLVHLPYAGALDWVRSHPPNGLTGFSSFTGGPGPALSAGFGYSEPDTDAWTNAWLQVGVAPLSVSTSAIAATTQVVWLDPRPLPDTLAGPRMSLTVGGGCPAGDADIVGVRNTRADLTDRLVPAADPTGGLICRYDGLNGTRFRLTAGRRLGAPAAAQVARALRALPLSHSQTAMLQPCPFQDGRAVAIALSYPGQPDVAIWWSASGCQRVANGVITAAARDFGATVDTVTASG
jgi:hypothetical protein